MSMMHDPVLSECMCESQRSLDILEYGEIFMRTQLLENIVFCVISHFIFYISFLYSIFYIPYLFSYVLYYFMIYILYHIFYFLVKSHIQYLIMHILIRMCCYSLCKYYGVPIEIFPCTGRIL